MEAEVFVYPHAEHQRSTDPGPFLDYRRYRRHVREEFKRTCVYCRRPEGLSGQTFEIDHYRPVSKAPELKSAWPNLYYCCRACNLRKGNIDSGGEVFIPNPCDNRMAEHLQTKGGGEIEAFTPAGEFTVRQLGLDAEELCVYRNLTQRLLAALLHEKVDLLVRIQKLEGLLSRDAGDRSKAELKLQQEKEDLLQLEAELELITGEGRAGASPA